MRSYKTRVQSMSRLSYIVRVPSGVYYFPTGIVKVQSQDVVAGAPSSPCVSRVA